MRSGIHTRDVSQEHVTYATHIRLQPLDETLERCVFLHRLSTLKHLHTVRLLLYDSLIPLVLFTAVCAYRLNVCLKSLAKRSRLLYLLCLSYTTAVVVENMIKAG